MLSETSSSTLLVSVIIQASFVGKLVASLLGGARSIAQSSEVEDRSIGYSPVACTVACTIYPE